LDGMVFSRLDESRIESGEFFALDEGQEWWLEELPSVSWEQFRPVRLEGRNWFWVYSMPRNVYAIFEPYQDQGVISYLILGEESALLWDTGMGIFDIRKCVEQLTDLPVTVLNSHDHFDHTGGNHLFENVMCYNIPSAIRTLTEGQTHLDLLEYVDPERIINVPKEFDKDHFYRIGKAPTATVEDGQVIDLGGRKLEVMYTPGHSASSIMLIDEANGLLFSGDTWYPGPLYAYMEDSSLPDYVESMRRAGQVIRERSIRWIYPSHNEVPVGTDLFFETTDFLQDVLDGKIGYEIDEGMRCYTMNSIVSLYMNLEETGN
jgi:glyoxylase-like metal-dependent hydrolase (beta-lactamase superfamily II)